MIHGTFWGTGDESIKVLCAFAIKKFGENMHDALANKYSLFHHICSFEQYEKLCEQELYEKMCESYETNIYAEKTTSKMKATSPPIFLMRNKIKVR